MGENRLQVVQSDFRWRDLTTDRHRGIRYRPP